MKTYHCQNPEETLNLAQTFGATLQPGAIVSLKGEIGAGKTQFVRGALNAFSVDMDAGSPTFTIANEYQKEAQVFYHFDMYRLRTVAELVQIGFDEMIFSDAISFIEWPENVDLQLPDYTIAIEIEILSENTRKITIQKNDEL